MIYVQLKIIFVASLSVIGAFVGSIIGGIQAEYLGRKKSLIVGNLILFSGLMCIWWAQGIPLLFVGRFLGGFGNGSNTCCIGPYTGEVCQPGLRKITGILGVLIHSIGYASFYVLGIYFHWRDIILAFVWWPIFCCILMVFCPESPSWLMEKGKSEDSKNSLVRLRQDVEVVERDIERISSNLEKQKLQHHANFHDKSYFTAIFGILRQGTFLRPFVLLSVLVTVGLDFTGEPAMSYYLTQTLSKLKLPLTPEVASAIVASNRLVLAGCVMILAGIVPRRRLYISGCLCSGMGCLIFAILNYLQDNSIYFNTLENDYPVIKWTPFIPIFLINIGAGLLVPITFTLMGELLPSNLRSFGSGILSAISYISLFTAVKAPPLVQENIGIDGLYFIFFGCCILLFFVAYFCLPETFGVPLEEIEDHYRGFNKDTRRMSIIDTHV